MDFLTSLAKGGDSKKPAAGEEKSSPADLFTSAKVVAEAAQAQYANQPEKYDKAKTAGAAADLLEAAEKYGKLDQTTGVGKYADQAEGYLRQYSAPKSAAPGAEIPSGEGAGDYVKKAEAEEFVDKPSEGGEKAEEFVSKPTAGGGAGDFGEKAEEFTSKPSEGEYGEKAEEFASKPSRGGGAGDYGETEEVFISKPSEGGEYGDKAEEFVSKPSGGGGYGGYAEKAEEFTSKPSGGGGYEEYAEKAEELTSKRSDEAGEYGEKAEEFIRKPSEGGEKGESEGGYGDTLKAAGGFFNK